jgi:hypothetical protein
LPHSTTLAWLAIQAAAVPALPEGPALTEAIAARDSEFFELLFEGCDPARMATMLTPDFEMYHDRGGVVAIGSEAFVADYARNCAARGAPDAWRSRRELLRPTLNVHPVPGFGAIEDGAHQFHERQGDGPERLAGRARFTQLWKLTPQGWQLARVFSYAHEPAGD